MKVTINIELTTPEEVARAPAIMEQLRVVHGATNERPPQGPGVVVVAQGALASQWAVGPQTVASTSDTRDAPAVKAVCLDDEFRNIKTMRLLVGAMKAKGYNTQEAILQKCIDLRARDASSVLAVIGDEDLESRVEAACEAMGIT